MPLFGHLHLDTPPRAAVPQPPSAETIPFPGGALGPRHAVSRDTSHTWLVAFSGALRNLRPLTEELQGRGIALPDEGSNSPGSNSPGSNSSGSNSPGSAPSAVLATLCAEIGFASAVRRLRGDFVAAAWDGASLWLARDPSGAGSLFYRDSPGEFAFGTDAGALAVDPVPDPLALRRFLTFGYLPSPHGLWPSVRRLPPGACLRLTPGSPPGSRLAVLPAVPIEANPQGYSDSRPRWARSIGAAVELMVQQRLSVLPEDEPVTVLHGGGVFSEAILSATVSRRRAPVVAAIATFPGEDGALAVAQARRWGAIPEVVPFRELPLPPTPEPLGDPLVALLLTLSAHFNNPVLTGLGGAATFGVEAVHARLRRERLVPVLRLPNLGLRERLPGRLLPASRPPDVLRALLLARGGAPASPLSDALLDADLSGFDEPDPLSRTLRFDRSSTLPDGLQHPPLLAPLLDHALSALLAQVPLGTLLPLRSPHGLFAEALADGLSGDRPRHASPLPLARWLAPHLPGLPAALDGWIDADAVRGAVSSAAPGSDLQRFRLVSLASWRRGGGAAGGSRP